MASIPSGPFSRFSKFSNTPINATSFDSGKISSANILGLSAGDRTAAQLPRYFGDGAVPRQMGYCRGISLRRLSVRARHPWSASKPWRRAARYRQRRDRLDL
jgi:hypothetical protein